MAKKHRNFSAFLNDVIEDDSFKKEVRSESRQRRLVMTLAAIRAAKDVSQEQVADVLGSTQSRVSKIENGYDADIRISEIEAYAKATGCEVTLMFSERGGGLAEQVKHHAFCIQAAMKKLVELAHTDEALGRGVALFHAEAIHNINKFLVETADKLPPHARKGLPYIRVADCDLLLEQVVDAAEASEETDLLASSEAIEPQLTA